MKQGNAIAWYIIGAYITGAITFILIWLYAITSWGLLLGLAVGWFPAIIGAYVVGYLWPLFALAIILIVLALNNNQSASTRTIQPNSYPSNSVLVKPSVTATAPAVIPANNNGAWYYVTSISGNTPKTSNQFTIKGKQWRISYKVGLGLYASVNINIEGGNTYYPSIHGESGADQYQLVSGPGTFYIAVDPVNKVSYTVTVEDYY